jgi:chlorite dismutase
MRDLRATDSRRHVGMETPLLSGVRVSGEQLVHALP